MEAAPNLSLGWNSSLPSSPSSWRPPGRSIAAAALLLLAVAGHGQLLRRLRCCCWGGRRRRMELLLSHLSAADLCCCALLLLPQLPPGGQEWPAGDAACRLARLLQGSAALAPAHVLAVMALEARGSPSAWPARGALLAAGWLLAVLLALPRVLLQAPDSPPRDGGCLAPLATRPRWHGQAYHAYQTVAGFAAPACLLGAACRSILASLREREPPPAPRGRVRALQLTLALAALFALCGFPRCLLDLSAAFGPPPGPLGGLLAAANAALNPFACLLFLSHGPRARRLQHRLCRCPDPRPRRLPRRHRHRPPPSQGTHGRPGLWFCPCQTSASSGTGIAQQPEPQPRHGGC